MLDVEKLGAVTKYRMARSLFGSPLYFTTAYKIDGLLIDTGCAHLAMSMCTAMREERIELIVNTHSHEDHIGANADLALQHECPIMAHENALARLASAHTCRLRAYQKVIWGRPRPSTAQAIAECVETGKYRFQVVYTPGHSSDHISLFEPEHGWLFCGDAYVGGKDRALRADYNVWQIIDSLKTMAKLQPSVLFPGGGTVKENGTAELCSKIAYLEDLASKVLNLAARGWPKPRIARSLFGREQSIAYITLGHFSGKNLVRSFLDDQPVCDNERKQPPSSPLSADI